MENKLFRKEAMERLASPEQLNEYVRVANPSVWMILSAIIVLLAGICVWGIFGHMDTVLTVGALSEHGTFTCYVKEADADNIEIGMPVKIDDKEYPVTDISRKPLTVTEQMDSYLLHIGNLQEGEWAFEVKVDASLEDGIYKAGIVTERIKPMSFLLN